LLARASSACIAVGSELHLLQPLYLLPKSENYRDRTTAQSRLIATLLVLSVLLQNEMWDLRMPYPPKYFKKFAQLSAYLKAELDLAKEVGVLPHVAAAELQPRQGQPA
jgi:hypothetical protein